MKKAQELPTEIRIYPKVDGEVVVSITVKYLNDEGEPQYSTQTYVASEQRTHDILQFFKNDIDFIHSTEGLYG